MFVSSFDVFVVPADEKLREVNLVPGFSGDGVAHYVTAATLGETNGHFAENLADWENLESFGGSIITSTPVPETGKTTLYLYAVLETA